MERTITITGEAWISQAPDTTVVSVNVNGVRPTYEEATKELCIYASKIKDAAEASGLDRDSVKTSSLEVKQHRTKVGTGKGYDDYKWVPDGFEFDQGVEIKFQIDKKILSTLIYNISSLDITPQIDFSFRNSNIAAMRDQALANASAEAKKRAETIVSAVGCRLGKLLSVNKPERDIERDYEYERMHYSMADCCYSICEKPIDVTPRDVNTSASVTLTWLIED